MNDQEDALREFIAEGEEMVDRILVNLNLLEKDASNKSLIHSIYRDVHTIKGSSHLFGFSEIGLVGHALESSLEPVRNGTIGLDSLHVDIINDGLDLIAKELACIKNSGKSSLNKAQISGVISRILVVVLRNFGGTPQILRDQPIVVADKPWSQEQLQHYRVDQAIQSDSLPVTMPCPTIVVEEQPATAAEISPAIGPRDEPKSLTAADQSEFSSEISRSDSVRVKVAVLDNLIKLAGDMVLVRNQVVQIADRQKSPEMIGLEQRMSTLTSDLQNEIMKTRMQPIDNLLSKFHLTTAHRAASQNKAVKLEIEGGETEVDKTLLESLLQPVQLVLDFLIDIALESKAERQASAKSEIGMISICCHQEGEQIAVTISDKSQGAGLGQLKNLMEGSECYSNELFETEGFQLLFRPEIATSIYKAKSLELDLQRSISQAKSLLVRQGGYLKIDKANESDELDAPLAFSLKIPMTLAIVPALIIRSQGQLFAIPQFKLVEMIRVDTSDDNVCQIKKLQDQMVLELRGQLIPLIALSETLGNLNDQNLEIFNIAILSESGLNFGLIVDEIKDAIDVVAKPFATFLRSHSLFTGSTVLGDGSIALVLDVTNLASRACNRESVQKSLNQKRPGSKIELNEYLIVELHNRDHYAIALEQVGRLEVFKKVDVDFSGKQAIKRYRGQFLPISCLTKLMAPQFTTQWSEEIPVVVVRNQTKLAGFYVNKIVDVLARDDLMVKNSKGNPLIEGFFHNRNQVLPILAVGNLFERAESHYFQTEKSVYITKIENEIREKLKTTNDISILCIEDSKFFRNQLHDFLKEGGFQVHLAEDGRQALDFLVKNGQNVDLIITDIEMPVMDGLEFTKEIRKHHRLRDLPIIAVTTRFRKKDVERGIEVGIDIYLEKLNKSQLMEHILRLLNLNAMAA